MFRVGNTSSERCPEAANRPHASLGARLLIAASFDSSVNFAGRVLGEFHRINFEFDLHSGVRPKRR